MCGSAVWSTVVRMLHGSVTTGSVGFPHLASSSHRRPHDCRPDLRGSASRRSLMAAMTREYSADVWASCTPWCALRPTLLRLTSASWFGFRSFRHLPLAAWSIGGNRFAAARRRDLGSDHTNRPFVTLARWSLDWSAWSPPRAHLSRPLLNRTFRDQNRFDEAKRQLNAALYAQPGAMRAAWAHFPRASQPGC